jgi:hypothetical protein
MSSGSCLASKLYDKIIQMPSKSYEDETIPLNSSFVIRSQNMLNLLTFALIISGCSESD